MFVMVSGPTEVADLVEEAADAVRAATH